MDIQEIQLRRLAVIQANPDQFNPDEIAWAVAIAPTIAPESVEEKLEAPGVKAGGESPASAEVLVEQAAEAT